MKSLKLCRIAMIRFLVALVMISSFLSLPGYCQESEDSQIFISGFNAYQQKDYAASIKKMNEVLRKFPGTPLRDMTLFWLSRAYFKSGNNQEAARFMSLFSKEFPDNPLRSTAEEELLSLTARYDKGEKLPEDPALVQQAKKTEQRLADIEAEKGRKAAEKAEQEQLAKTRREQEQAAAETARLAAERSSQERVAAFKASQARKAAEKAERERLAAVRSEEERLAAAARKIEEEKAAEAARQAAAKQEQERVAAEKSALAAEAKRQDALRQEQERKAAVLAEEQRLARQREEQEQALAAKALLREKAIVQFKSIIEKYPYTAAAATAAAKLQELGIAVSLPVRPVSENTQVLRLEVAQYAGFEFNLLPGASRAYEAGRKIGIPFEIINRGNGNDSFYLESGFPAEFNVAFAASATPEQAVNQTSPLAPGQSFTGIINLTIPSASIDGLRISHPIKAASRSVVEATQSRELALTASAPLLRAVLKTDKTQPLPGDKVVYRISILNVGSTAAQNVAFRLNFPSQMEPVDYAAAGFKQEMKSALALDGLRINSGENRELSVTLQVKEDSLAGQELLARAELVNNPLKTAVSFVSNISVVQPRHGVRVQASSPRLVVIPGQTITIPFIVTNTGNVREKFKIDASAKGASEMIVFHDLNRDSIRQANEPAITEIGPLEPKEEANVAMEIKTAKTALDKADGNAGITFTPEGDASKSAAAAAALLYSRPVLTMTMTAKDGQLKPGEIASFDLAITNRGSNLARVVELASAWPEQLELVAAEPPNSSVNAGNVFWNFKELGAGEKRTIRVSFKVRAGTGMGTNIQVLNALKYEDQLGNRY